MSDKVKALESALAQIEKQFGKNTVMRLGEKPVLSIPVISSGSYALDAALGVGGYPRGRIIEIYGPESSGKTTLALHAAAESQKYGGNVAFIDAEHALDPVYAKKLGVNVDELLVSQPDSGEQALEVCDTLVRSGAVDLVIVDSVAALTPRSEIEGYMGDSHMGLHARLMSQALRKLTGSISNTKTTVIFINQIRMKIGVMFGNPETTTGGNALKFYASIRLDVRRVGSIKKGDEVLGNDTRVKVVKNKVAPPFKQAEFKIMYDEGISRAYELLDKGQKNNTILKSGSWYSIGDKRLQGENSVIELIKSDNSVVSFIESGGEISESPKIEPINKAQPKSDVVDVAVETKNLSVNENEVGSEIDRLINAGLENGTVLKKRAWVVFENRTFHGTSALAEAMQSEPELLNKIKNAG